MRGARPRIISALCDIFPIPLVYRVEVMHMKQIDKLTLAFALAVLVLAGCAARPAAASSPVSHRHGGIYKRAAPPRKDFGLTNGAKYGMLPNVKFIAFTF